MLGKYERAIDTQADELSRARSIARQSGCSGLFSSLGRSDKRCGVINNTIQRMQRNMETLQRKRDGFAGKRDSREQQRILAALDAGGCNDKPATVRSLPAPVAPGADRQVLFERLNRGVIVRRSGPPAEGDEAPARMLDGPRYGSYRTLCVRTCDGFYFPISFATSPENFTRDENICRARCPDTNVELYYHVPEDDTEAMVSLAGAPYAELPNAFLYRRAGAKLPAGCGCGGSASAPSGTANYSVIAGKPPVREESDAVEPAASGSFVGAQPGASPAPATPVPSTSALPAPEDADRKVRVVGPTFLPDPSEAIDLQAPAPSDVR